MGPGNSKSTQNTVKENINDKGWWIVQDQTSFTTNSISVTRAVSISPDDADDFFSGGWTYNDQEGIYVALDVCVKDGGPNKREGAIKAVSVADASDLASKGGFVFTPLVRSDSMCYKSYDSSHGLIAAAAAVALISLF